MRKNYLLYLFLLFFASPHLVKAQLTGPADFEFWFGVPDWTAPYNSPQRLHLTNVSKTNPAKFDIDMPASAGFAHIVGTIPAGGSQVIDMTALMSSTVVTPANTVVPRGLRIQVQGQMGAYYADERFDNYGSIPLRGPNALGKSFLVPGQNIFSNAGGTNGSMATITATEDNAVVTITPSEAVVGHGANVPYTVTLNKGESYQVRSAVLNGLHLGGTAISSDKLIVVTYVDDLIQVGSAGDNGGDQLVPISKYGLDFAYIRTSTNGENVFLTASQDGTTIKVNDGTTTFTYVLNKGVTQRFPLTAGKNIAYIHADKPILAYQLGGQANELGSGILTAIESCKGIEALSFQYPVTAINPLFNFVVTQGSEGSFLINGSSTIIQASDFLPIPGFPGYLYARKDMTPFAFAGGSTIRIENTSGRFYFYQNIGSRNPANGTLGGGDFSNFSDFGAIALFPEANHVCGTTSIELKSKAMAFNAAISSYSWTGPNGFTSTQADPVLTNISPAIIGTYTLNVTDSGGCLYTETLKVDLPFNSLTVTPPSSTVCTGASVQFSSGVIPAESAVKSVLWTGPNGFTSTQANFVINDMSAANSGTYTCTYTDMYGCTISQNTTITVSPSLFATFTASGNQLLSCATSSTTLNATGYTQGIDYQTFERYNATSLFASDNFNKINTGFYSQQPTNTGQTAQMNLTGLTNITGTSVSYGVKYKGFLNISTQGSYTFYVNSKDGSNLYLDGSLLIGNDGSHGTTEIASQAVTLLPGYHSIEVNYFTGATGTAALGVSYAGPSIPKQAIPANVLYRAAGTPPANTYQWTDSTGAVISTTATATVSTPGIYTVTGTNALGCTSSINYEVKKIDSYDYGDYFNTLPAPGGFPVAQAKVVSCPVGGIPPENSGAVWAGVKVSTESAPLLNTTANADTFDDGLMLPILTNSVRSGKVNVALNSSTPGTTVYYGVWFDWNNNGNLADDGAFYSGSGLAGTMPQFTATFIGTTFSNYGARLIVSSTPVEFTSYDDILNNGEVEDYKSNNASITGNIRDDGNGLVTDNTVSSTSSNNAIPPLNTIRLNVVNAAGIVIGVFQPGGSFYNLSGTPTGNYSLVFTTAAGAGIVGEAAPTPSLPPGWVFVGENFGAGVGNDGTVNGIVTGIYVDGVTVTNANFGLDRIPTATPLTACLVDPQGNTKITVPILTGIDMEDGATTTGLLNGSSGTNTIKIETLPTDAVLYYNDVAVTAGQVIPNYNPNLLTIDPTDGVYTVSFTFDEVDRAGIISAPATVTLNTANAGPDQSTFIGNPATMAATGTGTWTEDPANPDPVVIADVNSPTTTITGFDSATATYNFTWTSTNGCTDTAKVGTPLSVIIANDDAGASINGAVGGTSLPDVLVNDTLNGVPVTTSTVITSFVSSTNPGISLSGTSVVVAAGTPVGNYSLTYQICEALNSTNCDQGVVTVDVVSNVDLSVVKTISDNSPTVGSNVTFTISVNNNGPSNATGVRVTDLLPSGYTYVNTNPPLGPYDAPTGLWQIGNLNNGASTSLSIIATVNDSGSYANTATVSANEPDPSTANNTSTVTPSPVVVADLSVVKTSSHPSPVMGTNVTFTIRATNNGPSNASGVNVVDAIPSGYTLISASPTVGTWAGSTWDIGNLASGQNVTMTVIAKVNDSGSYANTATINLGAPGTDPTPANNTSTVTPVPVAVTDLSVVKTASNPAPVVGANITFTITATNNGPSAATGINVTDILPTGYSFVSASASAGSYNNGTGIWNVGALLNGDNATLSIIAKVNAAGPYGNTATITGAQSDPTAANNTSTVTPVPTANADVAVTKIINSSAPIIGTNVIFTLGATNHGPSDATGVNVTDVLPAGYAFVSANPSVGTYNLASGVWAVGALANGQNETIDIVATVLPTGPYDNTASITATQADPNLANNSTTISPILPVASTDLSIAKVVTDVDPIAGGAVAFTLTATNNGPSGASGVSVTDLLPAGYIFVSATPSIGTYNSTTGIWGVDALANAASATLTINATFTGTPSYQNTASITGAETDPTTANNQSSVTPSVGAKTDLSVVKTISNNRPTVGTDVYFTIKATNNGLSAATNVKVTDQLPAGYTYISATPSSGTYDSGSGIWTIGSMANGESFTLTINATVKSGGSYTNTATIAGDPSEVDPTPSNNSSSVTPLPISSTDLSVVKVASNSAPSVGANITFTINAANNGPSDATNVNVNDVLPAGYTFVSATPSIGSYNASTGDWILGNVISGATASLSIIAKVNASGPYANTATIAGDPGEVDPTLPNNSSTVTPVPVSRADLSVDKVASSMTPRVGTDVTFTVTATNNGPSDATGVNVSDVIPAGYSMLRILTSAGNWTEPNWNIGNLAMGESVTLTVIGNVDPSGPYANTATIAGNETDPTAANNTRTVTPVPVASTDLSVVKGVNSTDPIVGTNVTFTIHATNNGASDAAGVNVNDVLTAGYTFLSATPSIGTWTTPNWNVGALTSGQMATLSIVARVNGNGPYDNTATVTGGQVDPTPPNNTSTVTPVPIPLTDLSIVKSVNNLAPEVGSNVSFVIRAINNGPSNATGVSVSDALPAGYTFVSATPSVGTWTSGTWTVGNLLDRANATLTIVATVNATGPYENTASITGNQTDPNLSNNSSTIAPSVLAAVVDTYPTQASSPTVAVTVGNVSTNDTINGVPVTTTNTDVTPVTDGPLSIDKEGVLTLAASTPSGTYTITYTICEVNPMTGAPAAPSNCASVTDTVVVLNPIQAVVENFPTRASSATVTTTVGNVTTSDTLMGVPVTASNTDVTPIVTGPLSIDSEGVLTLAPNTPSGSYTITYSICEVDPATGVAVTPANCSSTTETVVVSNPIVAVKDTYPTQVSSTTAPKTVGNVALNDTLMGAPVTAINTDVTPVVTGPLSIDANGVLSLAPNTGSGTYTITYSICEVNPTTGVAVVPANCSSITDTVVVLNPIDAVNDTGANVNGITGGVAVPDVLINDTLNGLAVTSTNVITTFVSATNPGITLSGTSVRVAAGTPGGNYTLTYSICEKLAPTNCDTAVVTVFVMSPGISVIKTASFNDDNHDGFAQAGETVTYHFTVANMGNVPLTNVTLSDPKPGIVISGGPIALLTVAPDPKSVDSTTFTGIYKLTQEDITSGSVSNQAEASGAAPDGYIVKDLSDGVDSLGNTPTVLAVDGCTIEVFNAMSPNSDGTNDGFYIRGLECYPENRVEIYNRWGVLVYEKDGYDNTNGAFVGVSDGRTTISKSQDLPVGVYYYILKYKDKQGQNHQKAGYLYINRK